MPPFTRAAFESGPMTHQPAMEKRKPRADAIRNRERVLEAAKAVFSQGGPEASLEAVAQACRRRDRDTVSALPDQGGPLRGGLSARGGTACRAGQASRETEDAPVEALRRWLQAGVEFMATKKGMAAALAMAAHGSSELVAYSLDRLTWAVGELLRRAAAAGEIRADIDPEDLLRTLVGMCYAHDGPGWQAKVLRLVDVFIDGLRRRPDKRRHRQA